MAFITAGGSVISYAEAVDVRNLDQRLFESNEIDFANVPDAPGSLDDYVEDLAQRTTDRINAKIKANSKWPQYLSYAGISFDGISNIPDFDPNKIVSRKQDFTDMCAFGVLYMYLLPRIADFGNPESSEVQKIQYYERRFNEMFAELMSDFTWYDADNSGSVTDSERMVTYQPTRRTRSKRSIARVS
jgi:hypothetical protein